MTPLEGDAAECEAEVEVERDITYHTMLHEQITRFFSDPDATRIRWR
ncbi:MAG: hypothetical protein R3D05_10225 [Dongiaceae bacterium]